jgi:PAT family beta-lactamase induction signal transducer AmpG
VFVWLATRGHDVGALYVVISVDNLASGFSGTCLIAYMSSLTSSGFTATQYALFSSLYALPGKLIASQSGRIVESAARSAEAGGLFAPLTGLFTSMSADAFVGSSSIKVAPASLGVGYSVFFIYSCLIGVLAIILTLIIIRKQPVAGAATPSPSGRG